MSIYVARLNDGSCLIGEANSESDARENFLYRWNSSGPEPDELILSVREMPKSSFLSRWWPSEHPEDEGLLPGRLDGGVDDDCDVYEHEYPRITAAHQKGSSAVANLSDESPVESSLGYATSRGSIRSGTGRDASWKSSLQERSITNHEFTINGQASWRGSDPFKGACRKRSTYLLPDCRRITVKTGTYREVPAYRPADLRAWILERASGKRCRPLYI
jgi:hypothetical protein